MVGRRAVSVLHDFRTKFDNVVFTIFQKQQEVILDITHHTLFSVLFYGTSEFTGSSYEYHWQQALVPRCQLEIDFGSTRFVNEQNSNLLREFKKLKKKCKY